MASIPKTTERWMFMFDIHAPEHDERALRLAREFQKDFRPHHTVFGGDLINCDSASSFGNESARDLADEYAIGNSILDEFKPDYVFEGNHEQRIRRADGQVSRHLRDLLAVENHLKIKQRGAVWLPYHNTKGVLHVGKLSVLHGWYCNEYAAKKTAGVYGCCLFGHTHRFQQITPKQAFARHTGFMCGHLAKPELAYEGDKPPRGHIQGFCYGYFHKSGHFNLFDVRLVGNEFVINGRYYKL